MEKSISRRRFLKTSGVTVGTIAAADLTAISRAFARQADC